MRIHGRNKALIGVLAAAFIAVLPGTAFAGHDLGIYKVEKQVDLNSDDLQVDISCGKNDYALDGMWRIDHADQDDDDPYITSIGRAVDVQEAYPEDLAGYDSDGFRESYHFYFNKNAIGRAQLKVWVVCLKSKTEVDGHQHDIEITDNANLSQTFPFWTIAPGQAQMTCPANTFIAAPGYKIQPSGSDPAQFVGHLYEDWPVSLTKWSWKMDISQDQNAPVTFYSSCVKRKVPLAGGEKHKLVYRLQGPETNSIPKNSIRTKRISCASHYKAVVAGMSFDGSTGLGWDPNPDYAGYKLPYHWWLGMDPQPKSRDFRFLNSDPTNPMSVDLKAICLNYRTT